MQVTLKAARVNRGITQQKAAESFGIRAATLSKYELGKAYPPIPTIKKMESLYGISYNDIIFCPEITL